MTEKDHRRIVAELYDEWARSYDTDNLHSPHFSHSDKRYSDLITEHTTQLASELILDVGCGTGTQTLSLADLRFQVVGIDISSESIKVARNKASSQGLSDRVHFIVCDACYIPIRDAAIGSVISFGLVLSHIPDYHRAIAEIARVMRRSAYFMIEFENKWSIEIPYFFLDTIARGRILGSFPSLRHIRSYIQTGLYDWEYKGNPRPQRKVVQLRTFSEHCFKKVLTGKAMMLNGLYGVHVGTLMLPTSWQEHPESNLIASCSRLLAKLDTLICTHKIFRKLGNSIVAAGYRD